MYAIINLIGVRIECQRIAKRGRNSDFVGRRHSASTRGCSTAVENVSLVLNRVSTK